MYYKEADFQDILKKLAMTLDQAYKVFDLPVGTIDKNMIKRKYRQLAIKHHPDHGGEEALMKLINEAKDRLDKVTDAEAQKADQRTRWQEEKRKREEEKQSKAKELKKYSQDIQKKMANLKDKYIQHFKSLTGQDYKMLVKEKINAEYSGSIYLDYKFKAEDGSQFHLHKHYSFGYGDIGKPEKIYYEAYFYYNQKETRMHRSRFETTKDENDFSKPEIFFPKKKITTIISKAQKADPTVLKKKDAVAILEREFGAKWVDKDNYRVPIDKDRYVFIMRMTFMKQGSWSINGLYEKYRRTHVPVKYTSYFESYHPEFDNNFKDFLDVLRKIKKGQYQWKEDPRRR